MKTDKMTTPSPAVILLNEFPGVGKYTIARALKSSIADQHPSVPTLLIDNHMLIDPATAVHPERNSAHYLFRRKHRRAKFLQVKDLDPKAILIMTCSFTHEGEWDRGSFWDHVELAKSRGVEIVYVNLRCGAEENEIRMCSEERRRGREMGVKGKLVDVERLRDLKKQFTDLSPKLMMEDERMEGVKITCFEVDNGGLSVEEAVKIVKGFLVQ
jgi:chloramphenicol 3-O-phosphotransferase